MRSKLSAAGFCAALMAMTTCANFADAAPKKKQIVTSQSQATIITSRPRARITVERRSFLDAGTEVVPGERKFTDYAIPPNYSPLNAALGPFKDYRRAPLLDPWDFPGTSKSW